MTGNWRRGFLSSAHIILWPSSKMIIIICTGFPWYARRQKKIEMTPFLNFPRAVLSPAAAAAGRLSLAPFVNCVQCAVMHNNVNSHVAVCNFENVNFDVIDGLLLSSSYVTPNFIL